MELRGVGNRVGLHAVGANCAEIDRVTLSSKASGNNPGLTGSSDGDDSQVPGTETISTSGQLAG